MKNCYLLLLVTSMTRAQEAGEDNFIANLYEDTKTFFKDNPLVFLASSFFALILLCFVCSKLQHVHQRAFLQQKLPLAKRKLYKQIVLKEQVLIHQEASKIRNDDPKSASALNRSVPVKIKTSYNDFKGQTIQDQLAQAVAVDLAAIEESSIKSIGPNSRNNRRIMRSIGGSEFNIGSNYDKKLNQSLSQKNLEEASFDSNANRRSLKRQKTVESHLDVVSDMKRREKDLARSVSQYSGSASKNQESNSAAKRGEGEYEHKDPNLRNMAQSIRDLDDLKSIDQIDFKHKPLSQKWDPDEEEKKDGEDGQSRALQFQKRSYWEKIHQRKRIKKNLLLKKQSIRETVHQVKLDRLKEREQKIEIASPDAKLINKVFGIRNSSDGDNASIEEASVEAAPNISSEYQRVSILRRNGNIQHDIHMKIIVQHKEEEIQEKLAEYLENTMEERKTNKPLLVRFWQALGKTFRSCCSSKKQIPYLNMHPIDTFIDNYWLINCPESKSVGEIDTQVYNLLHQLFIVNETDISRDFGADSLMAEDRSIPEIGPPQLALERLSEFSHEKLPKHIEISRASPERGRPQKQTSFNRINQTFLKKLNSSLEVAQPALHPVTDDRTPPPLDIRRETSPALSPANRAKPSTSHSHARSISQQACRDLRLDSDPNQHAPISILNQANVSPFSRYLNSPLGPSRSNNFDHMRSNSTHSAKRNKEQRFSVPDPANRVLLRHVQQRESSRPRGSEKQTGLFKTKHASVSVPDVSRTPSRQSPQRGFNRSPPPYQPPGRYTSSQQTQLRNYNTSRNRDRYPIRSMDRRSDQMRNQVSLRRKRASVDSMSKIDPFAEADEKASRYHVSKHTDRTLEQGNRTQIIDPRLNSALDEKEKHRQAFLTMNPVRPRFPGQRSLDLRMPSPSKEKTISFGRASPSGGRTILSDTMKFQKEASNPQNYLQVPKNLVLHQELIQAIMIDIKPNVMHLCCKRYTKCMIKEYFRAVRKEIALQEKVEQEVADAEDKIKIHQNESIIGQIARIPFSQGNFERLEFDSNHNMGAESQQLLKIQESIDSDAHQQRTAEMGGDESSFHQAPHKNWASQMAYIKPSSPTVDEKGGQTIEGRTKRQMISLSKVGVEAPILEATESLHEQQDTFGAAFKIVSGQDDRLAIVHTPEAVVHFDQDAQKTLQQIVTMDEVIAKRPSPSQGLQGGEHSHQVEVGESLNHEKTPIFRNYNFYKGTGGSKQSTIKDSMQLNSLATNQFEQMSGQKITTPIGGDNVGVISSMAFTQQDFKKSANLAKVQEPQQNTIDHAPPAAPPKPDPMSDFWTEPEYIVASSKDPRIEMAEQLELQEMPQSILKESVLSSLRQSKQTSTKNQKSSAIYIPPRDTLEAHMIDRSRIPSYVEGKKRNPQKRRKSWKRNLRKRYKDHLDPSANPNQPTSSRDPNAKTSHSVYMTSQQSKRPRKSTKGEDISALQISTISENDISQSIIQANNEHLDFIAPSKSPKRPQNRASSTISVGQEIVSMKHKSQRTINHVNDASFEDEGSDGRIDLAKLSDPRIDDIESSGLAGISVAASINPRSQYHAPYKSHKFDHDSALRGNFRQDEIFEQNSQPHLHQQRLFEAKHHLRGAGNLIGGQHMKLTSKNITQSQVAAPGQHSNVLLKQQQVGNKRYYLK